MVSVNSPLMPDKRAAGKEAEDAVVELLKQKGYRILGRNFSTRLGELDIIAEENGDLVFVEVRFRRSSAFGTPQESINKKKQGKLIKAALSYIKLNAIGRRNVRFDVAAVGKNGCEIVRDAFQTDTFFSY